MVPPETPTVRVSPDTRAAVARIQADTRLAESWPCRQFLDRMHGGGASALRAHRSYLAISHGIIVLPRSARWEGFRPAARAIFATALGSSR